MNIGIATFHAAHNYGAMLQTYALKTACEKFGATVSVINYTPDYIKRQYEYFKVSKNAKSNLLKLFNLPANIKKQIRFEKFKNNLFNLKNESENTEYDAVLYGSDQIWNPAVGGDFDPFFFGCNNISAKRNVAYAASIGKTEFNEKEKISFKKLVKNLSAISVREESAEKMVSGLTDMPVNVTLDPTLLTEAADWEKAAARIIHPKKYILVYEVSVFPETETAARALSAKTGLPIVRILYNRTKLKYGYKTLADLGPAEFLGWIKNAEYVVTSSFHGTALSILFEKEFYTVPHRSYPTRMTDLLSKLELSERVIFTLPEKIEVIDYKAVGARLAAERKKSLDFIKKSINL